MSAKKKPVSAPKDLANAIKTHEAGKLGEAEILYRKVLKEQPGNSVALGNLGVIAFQVGKFDAAVILLHDSLKLSPGHPSMYNHLGNAYAAMNQVDNALEAYRRALRSKPDFIEAHYNMGIMLGRIGKAEETVAAMKKVIELKPDYAEAYNVLGLNYDKLGRVVDALNAYQQAIRLRPNFAIAYNNMGNTLIGIGQVQKALTCYRDAIKHKSDFTEALFNLGGALDELGKGEEAVKAFRAVVNVKPQLAEARFNLTKSLQKMCDWRDPRASQRDFADYLKNSPGHVDPFFLLSQDSSPAEQLFCAQGFARRGYIPPERRFSHTPAKAGKRKLRIGYISGNFQRHPNAYLSVGMFEHHDRSRFEVFGYSYGADDKSEMRKRVEKSFDHFIDLRAMTHAEAAKRINDDKIDILIDRQGYTTRHRMEILAYRPAPIQVNYLGYPGTMGANHIDYIIGDRYVTPLDHQPFYMEKIVQLPHCYQSTDDRQLVAETPTRAECGLPEKAFVFCCFNNTNKIRPDTFAIWMRLLKEVPGSVLWLLGKHAKVKENLQREARDRGIDPERLIFAPPAEHAKHLARQRLADLFLDTLPYNAHTTASDALWVGLPVLTCLGQTFAGRVAASILYAIDMPELITHTPEEYELMALKLARNPKALASMRKKLVKNARKQPLFDTAAYTKDIEKAYLAMWKRWESGEPAAPIAAA